MIDIKTILEDLNQLIQQKEIDFLKIFWILKKNKSIILTSPISFSLTFNEVLFQILSIKDKKNKIKIISKYYKDITFILKVSNISTQSISTQIIENIQEKKNSISKIYPIHNIILKWFI